MTYETLPVDHRSTLTQIGQVVAYGQSIIAGNAVSDPSRDVMTTLAAMLGAKEYNWAKGGAIMMWENDIVRNEFGVVATVLQTWKRPIRAATTIATVDPAIGATVLTTAQNPLTTSATGPPFQIDDLVHVGTGTNGELCRVTGLSSTQITLSNFEGYENYGGLVRDHALGEPVFTVPHHYRGGNTLFLVCAPGHSPMYHAGVFANSQRWFKDAARYTLSRLRAAEIFEPDHTALVFAGSWGSPAFFTGGSGSTAAQGARNPTAVSASVTFHVPDNFPGGTISFNCLTAGGNPGGGVWTFTIDGSAAGTLTQVAAPTVPVNKTGYWCNRFTGLAAGRHTIVATMTTYEANSYFDYFGIEAEDPPIIVMWRNHRLYSQDPTAIAQYGHLRSTLQAQANPAATAVVVNTSALGSPVRQFAATAPGPQVPAAGEYLIINPRTSLEEVRTVTTVSGASAPFTINFSGGGLVNTHPVGTRVEMGACDYMSLNIDSVWTDQVKAEFDDNVVLHDPEPYVHPQASGPTPPSGGPKSGTYFAKDAAHFNEQGQALVAQKIYDQLLEERRINSRTSSRMSRPVSVPPTRVGFLDTGVALAWTNMPAALSEFPLTVTTNAGFRRVMDLSRYYEARIGCVQTVIGASTAKLRIQYSIDQGTTWRYLHRVQSATDTQATSTNWAESTAATDPMCQIDVGSTLPTNGVKLSVVVGSPGGWSPIYPEALMQQYIDVMLRVVGIGGDGVADPAFTSIWLELR